MTPVSFYMTAGLLGILFSEALLIQITMRLLDMLRMVAPELYHLITNGAVVGLVCLTFNLAIQGRQETNAIRGFWLTQLRLAMAVAALLPLIFVLAHFDYGLLPLQFSLAFGLALGAQLIGRWQFYERLNEREL